MSEMMPEFNNFPGADPSATEAQNVELDQKTAEFKKQVDAQQIPANGKDSNLNLLLGVKLLVTVELGRANLSVKEVLELQKGSVIELNRIAGEAVDVYVNDSLIARGDVVVVDDKFGVRITELVPLEKSVY